MFANPKKATQIVVSKSKGSKRPEIEVEGVEQIAALEAIISALTARKDTLAAQIKEEVVGQMVAEATETGKRPTNPRLVEGNGSCGFELRARSSASALTDEVFDMLAAAGVPVVEKVITPSYLAVNPEYADNQDMLAKADKYLSGKPGIPSDFIIQTEAVSKKIVGEGAIEAVFEMKNAETIYELLPHVSINVLSKLTMTDFSSAVEVVLPELATLCGVELKA